MDGRIKVTSEKNNGSCFSIEIPQVEIGQETDLDLPKGQLDLNTIRFSGEPVLVVDDQPPIRFMLREILEKLNLSVIEASNGKEAVGTAAEKQPRIILMDAKMPKMDGFTAARKLKTDPKTRDIPICLMTASMRTSSKSGNGQESFMALLTKPIIIKDLIQVLARVLPGREISDGDTLTPQNQSPLFHLNADRLDPELARQLEIKVRPELGTLSEGMKISDISRFAEQIIDLGSAFGTPELEDFGRALLDQTQTFDIEKINLSLKALSRTLEKLSA